jgi:tight adherence protein B
MDLTVLLVVLVVLMAAVGLTIVFLTMSGSEERGTRKQAAQVSDSLRAMVQTQRQAKKQGESIERSSKKSVAVAAAAEGEETRGMGAAAKNTLARRLVYARWPISDYQFRAIQVAVTILLAIPAFQFGNNAIRVLVLFLAPSILNSILEYSINKRFKAFDKDYPPFLLQYVSLLKTGMATIPGLEAAAKGLEEDSLMRSEVELLIDRLRLGLTEEQAINAFGEDIRHPELELFIQSLLLSKRVGGQLSNTLERLAKQVRKRQQFRDEAVAAVGLEQNSMYAIAFIMTLLMSYITFAQPELVLPALKDPQGINILQWGVALIIFGFYWSRKVTNIKV